MTIVETRAVTGGVDTHLDAHVAAALDDNGGVLGVESFPTTPAGFEQLRTWLCSFGMVARVGVEGTGAYGAGLARHLRRYDVAVVRSIDPTVRPAVVPASPIRPTQSKPPGRRSAVELEAPPRPLTATWRRCERY